MYSMRQLDIVIDSLEKEVSMLQERLNKNIYKAQGFVKYFDSTWTQTKALPFKTVKSFDELFPDSARKSVDERALSQINSLRVAQEIATNDLKEKEKILGQHKIEWHRKISLSLACLGVVPDWGAVGFYHSQRRIGHSSRFCHHIFYAFLFFKYHRRKICKRKDISAFAGMWIATFILVPIGLFLTYKAMRDSQLFNKEFYYRIARFFVSIFRK